MSAKDGGGAGPQVGDDDEGFAYGDWVEFKLDTNLFGIVVGFDCAGLMYDVQLAGCGCIEQFHGVTLRLLDGEDDDLPPLQDEVDAADNVIPVDFTRGVDLRTAPIKGAA